MALLKTPLNPSPVLAGSSGDIFGSEPIVPTLPRPEIELIIS
jgi:hypothetical protein